MAVDRRVRSHSYMVSAVIAALALPYRDVVVALWRDDKCPLYLRVCDASQRTLASARTLRVARDVALNVLPDGELFFNGDRAGLCVHQFHTGPLSVLLIHLTRLLGQPYTSPERHSGAGIHQGTRRGDFCRERERQEERDVRRGSVQETEGGGGEREGSLPFSWNRLRFILPCPFFLSGSVQYPRGG